jgi:heme oxygenase (mycobilin-producing)
MGDMAQDRYLGPSVRVLVWYRQPAGQHGAVAHAYHRVSENLRGTPGLLGSELLSSAVHPGSLAVHSEWTSLEAFLAWERGPDHRRVTAPLRPYQDPQRAPQYDVYQVAAKITDDG